MSKELDRLIELAKRKGELDKNEIIEFVHLKTSIENVLKAFEIIKEKQIIIGDFIFYQNLAGQIEKNKVFDLCCGCSRIHKPLTQEEYDLLKEVLK